MSLIDKNTIRPYICGVYLCFGTSFTAQTTFQNFYDTELLEADVVSLYATSSKVSFTETKTSSRSGELYQQRISISLPIGDNLRSEHINRIHQAEQVVLKLTNGEYLYIGRNDAFQNTKPKIAYNGDENTSRFQFTANSMAPFGYTDIENIGDNPDNFLFVLLDNGVTIRYLGDNPGDQGFAFGDDSGVAYTAVSTLMFSTLDPELDNYTNKCTTLVTDMSNAFSGASDFNQKISHFDTANVANMSNMFLAASAFNQNISQWNVTMVSAMTSMFRGAISFNQPLNDWDMSTTTDIRRMFNIASSFNQDLDQWDVSNCTNFFNLFLGATAFNGNITTWDVSNVDNFTGCFSRAISFNQNISIWNVSNATNMTGMFDMIFTGQSGTFNQDLSSWCVENILTEPNFFARDNPQWTQPKPNWGASC